MELSLCFSIRLSTKNVLPDVYSRKRRFVVEVVFVLSLPLVFVFVFFGTCIYFKRTTFCSLRTSDLTISLNVV